MISASDYHQRTKHSLKRYANGPETLDWDDQPDPFRHFDGCRLYPLTTPGRDLTVSWAELTQRRVDPLPFTLENVGLLLELAFGLAAWKQYGPDRWAVRCNPSSGNLHPSEVYLINTLPDWLPQGVYHYVSHDHQLEQRCQFVDKLTVPVLMLGLSSVHWREAWKYGERAFRYCQLDAGHAFAALRYAAACLGWYIEMATGFTDSDIATILGLDRESDFIKNEAETPDWLCYIRYSETNEVIAPAALLNAAATANWQGKAQSLKAYHLYQWSLIDEVSASTVKQTANDQQITNTEPDSIPSNIERPATTLIRQRRSAQHFNAAESVLEDSVFYRLLSALQTGDKPPFDNWPWPVAVHLCFFVHRVNGLTPGLYCLPRSKQGLSLLKANMNAEFVWQEQVNFPDLYLLYAGEVQQIAKTLSCHQAIAADGAFALAMLAEFDTNVETEAWHYRRLFWECGMLGQVLYLEAEAEGFRGTGIGCFFDDEVHHILGIKNKKLQSLYHFTVGSPFEDQRIQTFPAYWHLNQRP